MFYATIQQKKKILTGLQKLLLKAIASAEERKFDPNNFLLSRLAPDMHPLTRQIQFACDTAKFTAARLADKEAPKHEDNETTLEQLQARIQETIDYLDGFSEADFDGAEERRITLPFLPGKFIMAHDYIQDFATPNFYFHITTAYALLRRDGVPLGKRDYLHGMNLQDLES